MENVSRASVNYAFGIEICTDNRYNPIVLRHLKEIHMSLIGEILPLSHIVLDLEVSSKTMGLYRLSVQISIPKA